MKRFLSLLVVAILAGIFTLGAYKMFLEPEAIVVNESEAKPNLTPVNYTLTNTNASVSGIDFTTAAEKTVNAVVHVKQYGITRTPRNLMEFFRNGGAQERRIQGAGSGVIITEDGYIVTNNHVIDGATDLEITLNNNKSYKAKVVGTAPQSDIALIKIDAEEKLSYIPFGDSNSAKIGEWVLAVGNPFNLTSTVTAGIISAKSRDLDESDGKAQSFIQTDAAINPGNSGGALVNVRGELIGINTAITSQTGSYVGYAFAVPSNNAKKIIDDIIEFGGVQRGILGITGGTINPKAMEAYGISTTQGVVVASVADDSGAKKAGLLEGDVIKEIDGLPIRKFSDLTGYVNSKRPKDVINVRVLRKNKELILPVTLSKYEIQKYNINDVGVEVMNPPKGYLNNFKLDHGVVISKALSSRMKRYNLEGLIISEIDGKKVKNVIEVKEIIESKYKDEDITISLVDRNGQKREFVFQ
ncbi:Do/DeqQ family serine protease [Aquimarina sp. EL_43]|uniref:trypsin-like peptidase domain-containing protein n=1 Tax=Aquimarina TaxID=290174 RepID=UPI00046FABE2|nr:MULTISPECIES: trypsin-like peptidase domain-containing protein [Aquimarina]MBG6132063.1 Do/DeqQ family serine protease [Aquimarina sp. EL_35]MBG6152860.1 Do/DeqQ family serine protease [Aquimarina sp. EL_32]MBG6170867.1 Do/DeqQ family serine protease [Aquimarina sp. EL_43]